MRRLGVSDQLVREENKLVVGSREFLARNRVSRWMGEEEDEAVKTSRLRELKAYRC